VKGKRCNENAKMRGCKCEVEKYGTTNAGTENAGLENAVVENAGKAS